MASISDILSATQNGVVAFNALTKQMGGSFTNIAGQFTTINSQITTLSSQIATINSSWTAYTPNVTSQAGSFSSNSSITVSGLYKQIGKTVIMQADVLLTALGSGAPAQGLRVSLPVQAAGANFAGTSREILLTGQSGSANVIANSTLLDARDFNSATYISTGNQIVVGVTYEST